jgi:CSLREA domain-containing protein
MLSPVDSYFRHRGAIWLRAWLLILVASAFLLGAAGAGAMTFTVNSSADIPDDDPLSGLCETAPGNGICTLRGAIQAANVHAGADSILLKANTTYLLTQPGADEDDSLSGDLDITDSVTIVGAGPGSTIIDGNGAATGDRVFQIFMCTGRAFPCDVAHPAVITSLSGMTIQHGQSSNYAGGIFNGGTLTLTDCFIANNIVSGLNDWGGGIFSAGTLNLISSTVADNTTGNSNAYGGGILNQGPMTITNSTISGNKTFGTSVSPGYGGGIYTSAGTATITGSTISGNTAAKGGAIFKIGNPLIVVNSTISGNYSTSEGGGIYARSGTTDLYNATVTNNTANSDETGVGRGGGVANESGSTLNFRNSIVAMNLNVIEMMPFPFINDDDCFGTITSGGNNVMHAVDTSYCTVAGAATMADPNLGVLQFNGGPTPTHALLAGSVAIDGVLIGDCTDNFGATLTTDQRGVHRPGGVRCDIGAFEANDIIFRNGFEP